MEEQQLKQRNSRSSEVQVKCDDMEGVDPHRYLYAGLTEMFLRFQGDPNKSASTLGLELEVEASGRCHSISFL